MHWTVAQGGRERGAEQVIDPWLVPFVPGDRHQFTIIPSPSHRSFHQRARSLSGIEDWASSWRQGTRAWRQSRGGVIITFPQLAFVAGLRQRLARNHKPLVAWAFNVGSLYGGAKRTAARTAFADIERFVVHSRGEIARYAEWLRLPAERFNFVHFQRARFEIAEREDPQRPFVLAMGSAHRDYATFLEAVRQSRLPTLVIAASHALKDLEVPSNVAVQVGLTPHQCRVLAKRATVTVVPVLNEETASGQVTVVEAMRMGRPVIATRCMGTEDYLQHGVTGLLVHPRDVQALRAAIELLWSDADLRAKLGENAERFAEQFCSDETAGAALGRILDEIETRSA